jgi:hypothetical protein
MKVTGGCHCGHITYEAEVDPGTSVLKSGTPKLYLKTAESGKKRVHAFCPDCGAPIYATSPEPNQPVYGLRFGGIDQRAQLAPPARQQWCRSALPWSMDLTQVERAERQSLLVAQPRSGVGRCFWRTIRRMTVSVPSAGITACRREFAFPLVVG